MGIRKKPEETSGKFVSSPLFKASEAAKYLGVSRGTIYRLMEWGEIQAVKLGRSLQVQKESLDRYRAQRKLT